MNPVNLNKRPVIGIFGSGTHPDNNHQLKFPFKMGEWIARNDYHLLTGGGAGIMKAACAGFCTVEDRKGLSIGIIPSGKDPAIYPNLWVELPIHTHLQGLAPGGSGSRNHINVLTSDVMMIFTGGIGTKSELEIAVNTYDKGDQVIVCLQKGEFIYDLDKEALEKRGLKNFATNVEEAIPFIEPLLNPLTEES